MVRPFCSCYIASDNFSQEGIPLSILPALMSGRQRGWLCRNVVLNLRVGGGVVGSRPALFRFPTHQLLNREAPKMYRHPSILTLYYYFFSIFTFGLYPDDISSAERLLRKIVPLGSMPSMPDGFPSLSELKTDKFDYSTNRGKVTVTADLEDPVRLLGEGMILHDVQMTFKYNKNIPGGRWRFNAEGEFMDHSNTSFPPLFVCATCSNESDHSLERCN